jgi:uncharacterized protein
VRVVLDTNVIISALARPVSLPGQLLFAWRKGQFTLLCCAEQLAEIRRVSRYGKIAALVSPPLAGKIVNQLKRGAAMIDPLPTVDRSPDPFDNYLLALAEAGSADYLVTGDKADLLALGRHGATRIVPVRAFAEMLGLQ